MQLHFISAEVPWLFTRSISKNLEVSSILNQIDCSTCFVLRFIIFLCMSVCLYVSICTMWSQWLQRPDKGMGSPWTGLRIVVNTMWMLGTESLVLCTSCKCCRSVSYLSCLIVPILKEENSYHVNTILNEGM